jgi:hypothetical protein
VLYVIAGDGTGNKTEIEGSLTDLMNKAVEAEQEFWFAVKQGDKDTSKNILAWIKANEVYFDGIGAKITGAAEQREADTDSLIEFMTEFKDEGVELLALFVDADDDVEEDAELMALVEAAVGAGFTTRLLNGQMTKVSFAEEGGEEVEEEQTGTLAEDEEEQVEEAAEFTESDLKKMTVPELTAMAKGQGLDVKAIGKGKADLIAAILAQQEAAEGDDNYMAEPELEEALDAALEADEAPAASNGYSDPSDIVKSLLAALGKALIAASK